MKQNENNSIHWIADEGMEFARVSDDLRLGTDLYLGADDTINNYKEVEITQ